MAKDIRAQQGLATGEDQHRHAEALEIVHHGKDLVGRQLTREILVGGDGIAVLAGEIAAPDKIPDHHWRRWVSLGPGLCRRRKLLHVLRYAKHRAISSRNWTIREHARQGGFDVDQGLRRHLPGRTTEEDMRHARTGRRMRDGETSMR
jgi:hypothetical protein